jgi:hypothetical protein
MPSALAWKTNYLSEGLSLLTSEYQKPRPVATLSLAVTAISPANGVDAGGTAVTITGSGFSGATGAAIGGVALTSFVAVSPTQVTGIAPAGLANTAQLPVTVTTPLGTGTLAAAWEYLDMLVGLLSARPAFGTAGRAYFATDTNVEYIDTGSAWVVPTSSSKTGQSTHAIPDANDTFTAADNAARIVKVTGTTTADRTLALTLPATDASAFDVVIVNATSGGFNIILSGGNANTASIAPGSAQVRVDSTGLYLVNTVGVP